MHQKRRIIGLVAAAAVLIPAGLAWACVGIVVFKPTGSASVQPGSTIEMFGGEFARGRPVDIRLGSPTGPVLATHENPLPSTMTSQFTIDVPIPADLAPGEYVLVATQEHQDMNSGIPARSVIYVGVPEPTEPAGAERPLDLLTSSGPSTGSLVLIGLGVAAAGLLVAAGFSAAGSRRSPTEAEPVSGS